MWRVRGREGARAAHMAYGTCVCARSGECRCRLGLDCCCARSGRAHGPAHCTCVYSVSRHCQCRMPPHASPMPYSTESKYSLSGSLPPIADRHSHRLNAKPLNAYYSAFTFFTFTRTNYKLPPDSEHSYHIIHILWRCIISIIQIVWRFALISTRFLQSRHRTRTLQTKRHLWSKIYYKSKVHTELAAVRSAHLLTWTCKNTKHEQRTPTTRRLPR
jgi:hypothetical protein